MKQAKTSDKVLFPDLSYKIMDAVFEVQNKLGPSFTEDKIVLELKAINTINDLHKAQLLAYLKASKIKLGNLINFGTERVEYKRIAN